jgi:regulation of enolase protein 1 (concanavalin A-like superfamily)
VQSQPIASGTWLNPPLLIEQQGNKLFVTAKENSDFWRTTSYGFVHDSGHGLLNEFPQDSSVELTWLLNYREQFDQAGLLVWANDENWTKAGIEFADGAPQLGAVCYQNGIRLVGGTRSRVDGQRSSASCEPLR